MSISTSTRCKPLNHSALTDLRIPRGTRRIIIELGPGRGLSTFALVTQGPVGFSSPGFESRLVIDVV